MTSVLSLEEAFMYQENCHCSGNVRFLELRPAQCTPGFQKKWKDLEAVSLSGNAFLSPEYVQALAANRPPERQPLILACENPREDCLIGLGVFDHTHATRSLPLPHLVSLQNSHVYRNGFLVHERDRFTFYRQLFGYLSLRRDEWSGIEFTRLRKDSQWARELQEVAAELGGSFRLLDEFESPVVDLHNLSEEGLQGEWSSSRRKTMRKNRKRLEKMGTVEFRLLDEKDNLREALEIFLQLEEASWKGELGTALNSSREELEFARQLLAHSEQSGFLLMSQLLVDGEVAATAMNFRSGRELFAFKIAWDQRFEKCSPGTLHEVALVDHVREHLPEIERIDSCSSPDSYLTRIWPHRTTIGSGLLCTSLLARGTGKLICQLKTLKRWASDASRNARPSGSAENE